MNVIVGGSDAFDAVLYPQQSTANQSYIEQQLCHFSDTISDAGRAFLNSARAVYEQAYSVAALHRAQLAIAAAGRALHPNQISTLYELNDLQNAPPVMQRWIMAEPTLRDYYNRQTCVGYGELYEDVHGKVHGEAHYDYRRVMDGIGVETEDGWYAAQYPDELMEDDRDLTHLEQISILETWDAVRFFINQKRDPSDPEDGLL